MSKIEKRLLSILLIEWILYVVVMLIVYRYYPLSHISDMPPLALFLLFTLYIAITSAHIVYLIYLLSAPNTSMVKLLTWLMTIANLGYTLPLAISTQQEHSVKYKMKIGWCNLLLGWTVIGWVVTLYFAIVKFKRSII